MKKYLFFVGCFLLAVTCSNAQYKLEPEKPEYRAAVVPSAVSTNAKPVSFEDSPIEAKADSLNYDKNTGWIEAKGHVIIKKGDVILKAEYVQVNANTEDAHAYGGVELLRGAKKWNGRMLDYNFKTDRGSASAMTYAEPPYQLNADKFENGKEGDYKLYGATATTCTNDMAKAHYRIKAKEMTIYPGDRIKGKHATVMMGHVPVMYLPYWNKSINRDNGWFFRPGYSSKWGAYLLSTYRYSFSDLLMSESHIDYRQKRGVAVGEDLLWEDQYHDGIFSMYYADDKQPVEDDAPAGHPEIDPQRYRIKFEHNVDFTDYDYLMLKANYVSDIDFREDFFRKEFRQSTQPENFAVYNHSAENYTAGLQARTRLNDFYDSINRLPEAGISVMRTQLGDSPYYYDGVSSVGWLQHQYPKGSGAEDYDSGRLDTLHMIYRPEKLFGFLTVVPRAGFRGTIYTATKDETTSMQLVTVTTTNSVITSSGSTNFTFTSTSSSNNVTTVTPGGSKLRAKFEIGSEVSLKAYKNFGDALTPRRHVLEPYLNYTLVPEPSVDQEDLYQFDYIDTFAMEHFMKLGVRNKIQGKKKYVTSTTNSVYAGKPAAAKQTQYLPYDIIDVDIYTSLLFEKPEGANFLSDFVIDVEFTPNDFFRVDADGIYDTDGEGLYDMALMATIMDPGSTTRHSLYALSGEYRFRKNENNLIGANISLMPTRNWTYNLLGRYEGELSRLEEVGLAIQRNYDCMTCRTGVAFLPGYDRTDGSLVEDDYRIIFELTISAFPKFGIGRRNRDSD